MDHIVSFGYWVRRRRKVLDMTQADLARAVSCSLSMLRKIERDERRPSVQLAELLVDSLAVEDAQRSQFLQMARGQFVPNMPSPAQAGVSHLGPMDAIRDEEEGQTLFVARENELQQLHEHLDKAMDGKGRMVFVAGEAGRGKTSLLYEFTGQAMAARSDLIAAGGSSDIYSGLSDPLLPFRDIFRLLAGDIENAGMTGIINRELASRIMRALPVTAEIWLHHGPHLIDTLVPGSVLEARLSQSFPETKSSADLLVRLHDQRLRQEQMTYELHQDHLFEEISSSLNFLARQYPLLLILDDLHWIDTSSAGLLGHLALRLQQSPILLVGSFRPEDLAQGRVTSEAGGQTQHPLQVVLDESRRLFGQNRINLDQSGTELDFVNALFDQDSNCLDAAFRQQFARITEGNALFAVELLRDMRERGDIKQDDNGCWIASDDLSWEVLPARVEGVIEKRIGRLPDDLREMLTVASVQGNTFHAEVIAQVKQADARDVTHCLSADLVRLHRLIREQGIQQTGSERLSQYRFRHHLFQKYLYDQLGAAERMYLHEDVGNALEKLYGRRTGTDDVPAAQLARHFQQARLGGKASRYLLLAGQNAARLVAYDEAAAHFKRGLLLLQNLTRSAEIDQRELDLTIALAHAYWDGGYVAEAFSTYEKSIELARTLKETDTLASVVLAYEEIRWRLNLPVEASQQYMREALAALGDEEGALRVRLLVSLSRTLLASGEQRELRSTVDGALRFARNIDDPVALCDALRSSIHLDRSPAAANLRLEMIEEMMNIAVSIGDQERLADSMGLTLYDQLELGNIKRVDETIDAHRRLAEEMQQPFQLHIAAVFQTMRAILRGEFGEAERLADAAADICRQMGITEMDGIFGIQMFTIRAEQGRLAEVAPIIKLIAATNPAAATWRPGLALIYATIGERAACQQVFDELAADSFSLVPRDSMWVTSLAYLTEVCAYLLDRDRAHTLYELFLPYDGRTVVVGGATACFGAAARYLGTLAATLADWPAAERHFIGALELDERIGARPWLAHSEYEYGVMLLVRGQSADRQRALTLLDKAEASAREMGMAHLVQKINSLQVQ